jgi:hypothetical protein
LVVWHVKALFLFDLVEKNSFGQVGIMVFFVLPFFRRLKISKSEEAFLLRKGYRLL